MAGLVRMAALVASAEAHEDLETRRRFIGGSDANIIFSGDAGKDPPSLAGEARREAEPADLTDKLPGDARLLDRAVQPAVVSSS